MTLQHLAAPSQRPPTPCERASASLPGKAPSSERPSPATPGHDRQLADDVLDGLDEGDVLGREGLDRRRDRALDEANGRSTRLTRSPIAEERSEPVAERRGCGVGFWLHAPTTVPLSASIPAPHPTSPRASIGSSERRAGPAKIVLNPDHERTSPGILPLGVAALAPGSVAGLWRVAGAPPGVTSLIMAVAPGVQRDSKDFAGDCPGRPGPRVAGSLFPRRPPLGFAAIADGAVYGYSGSGFAEPPRLCQRGVGVRVALLDGRARHDG